mmetsp:Transcript_26805/g.44476  ORF Transcript_26805/g.44476 Transcript_26805/m.44476 type:complete len:211 (+) Transcript_26805:2924-3556(+)
MCHRIALQPVCSGAKRADCGCGMPDLRAMFLSSLHSIAHGLEIALLQPGCLLVQSRHCFAVCLLEMAQTRLGREGSTASDVGQAGKVQVVAQESDGYHHHIGRLHFFDGKSIEVSHGGDSDRLERTAGELEHLIRPLLNQMRRGEHECCLERYETIRAKRWRRHPRLANSRVNQRDGDRRFAITNFVGEYAATHQTWHTRTCLEPPAECR